MNREKFKELTEEYDNAQGNVINCRTEEDAQELLKLALQNGNWSWQFDGVMGSTEDDTLWDKYDSETCYEFLRGEGIRIASKEYYEKHGFKIIEFNESTIRVGDSVRVLWDDAYASEGAQGKVTQATIGSVFVEFTSGKVLVGAGNNTNWWITRNSLEKVTD